ncbi:MAG: hypothetical protein AB7T06_11085 [Kofleriaceae bacterium]
MRFSRELATLVLSALAGVLVAVLSACGTDYAPPSTLPDDTCEQSILTYDNFGELFMLDWCRGCHSSALPEGMRQDAPLALDFEDLETIRELAPMIAAKATGPMPVMPPAAGPSDDERALLAEWLACGAP